jgi:hypothetical protein
VNFQPYAISQSQMIGTYAPEQILKGKVLDILPDRTALVRLGRRNVIAQVTALQPPLKVGRDYFFQIEGRLSSGPLLARPIGRRVGDRQTVTSGTTGDILTALKLSDDPINERLVRTFLDHGEPLSEQAVRSARQLVAGRSDTDTAFRAVGWMINRHLPLTPAIFRIVADHLQAAPLADQLNRLDQLLKQFSQLDSPSSEKSLNQLLTQMKQISGRPGLTMIAGLLGPAKTADVLNRLIKQYAPQVSAPREALLKYAAGPMSPADTAGLLEHLDVRMDAAAFTETLQSALAAALPAELAKGQTIGLLPNLLMALGIENEAMLKNGLGRPDGPAATNTLKEELLGVAGDPQASEAIRQAARQAVQSITAQQLQMLSVDPAVAQFSMQIPLPFNKQTTPLSLYWEGKRNRQGMIDPGSCTILFYLDLPHLHRTLIGARIENHRISLTIQNDSPILPDLIEHFRGDLSERLEALDYRLLSITRSEKIDKRLLKKVEQPLPETNYRMDVRI